MAKEAEKESTQVTVEMGGKEATPAPSKAASRFDEFEQEMERMFESFLSRNWLRPFRDFPALPGFRGTFEARLPKVDVIERDAEIAVKAELPGFEKKDIEVSLTDRTLTIRGSTRKETQEEKGEYYRREISTGEISRTVTLPAEVDGTKAKAEFKDGLLEIVVPKTEKSNRVQVEVK
jgi:HSP20 family protein